MMGFLRLFFFRVFSTITFFTIVPRENPFFLTNSYRVIDTDWRFADMTFANNIFPKH